MLILSHTERRGLEGAKIYPFNAVIIVPEVKTANANRAGTVTVQEMRKVYRKATLKTADMNFSISH